MAEYTNKEKLIEQYPELDGYTFADVPTIDIVHCGECIHAKLNWADGEYYCNRHQDVFVKDYYCADGEREQALKNADNETLQSAT